jgi:hypothetical protein
MQLWHPVQRSIETRNLRVIFLHIHEPPYRRRIFTFRPSMTDKRTARMTTAPLVMN